MTRWITVALVVWSTVQAPTPGLGVDAGARAVAWFGAREAEFVELRHDLHRHPELSGAETRTAGIVADRLKRAGLDVRTGVGGQGVVALLRGGKPGPVVAYRADMDAVRSPAPDPVDYRSLTPGIRHICGHDVHTTIGIALAEALASARGELAGSVVFLFQPAEENATGANAMLAAGALDPHRPRAIFAVHTAPLPVGEMVTARETLMPARDIARFTIAAPPGSDAVAKLDVLVAAAATVGRQDAFRSTTAPFSVHDRSAIVHRPDGSTGLVAQFTVSGPSARAPLREKIAAAIAAQAPAAKIDLVYEAEWVAGVKNAPAVVDRAVGAARTTLGESAVRLIETMIPAFSEDFGSFQARVPGAFFFLGVSNPAKNTVGMPHSPDYVADDGAIAVGVRAMTAVLIDALR